MRFTTSIALAALLGLSLTHLPEAHPCTSILVSKGASAAQAPMITYAADSHTLYGELIVRPRASYPEGAMRDIYDWDTGKYLGKIRQARLTHQVVGLVNEHQVAIGETTFGGREELTDPTAVVDYGSLMAIALERATSARGAIKVMAEITAEYGYASSGESFSIADAHETWLMEMISKGPKNKGAVWVARRIPDGMVSAHANQARIRQFPLNDAANTLYAKDVISFARSQGYFTGKDTEFSFADAYAPMTFEGLRFCEARVWSVFRRAAPSQKLTSDAVSGHRADKPLPLWIKPDKKLSNADVMALMRDHFEGTEFDLSQGLGAGPYHLPYRFRPLTWSVDGKKYLNERSISTQQTGFSMVAELRADLPGPVGGLLWFGMDDTASTVYVPMYAGLESAPPSWAPGAGTLGRFSWNSAFWVFNWVANFAYGRYSEIILDIQKEQRDLEGSFLARQAEIEREAVALYKESPERARAYLSHYSTTQAEATVARWRQLGESLLVKYLDGNLKDEAGKVQHPGYPSDWLARVAAADGAALAVGKLPGENAPDAPVVVTGYFHSRAELGELGADVPDDFPFGTDKLLYVAGNDKCARPPACCVQPTPDATNGKLLLPVPEAKDGCGARAVLVRLPKESRAPLFRAVLEH